MTGPLGHLGRYTARLMKSVCALILVMGFSFVPLILLQFVSFEGEDGMGVLFECNGWPFPSKIDSIHPSGTGPIYETSRLQGPHRANTWIVVVLGFLTFVSLAFAFIPKFPRYKILDYLTLVAAVAVTATFSRFDFDLLREQFSSEEFQYSSLHWRAVTTPWWLNAGFFVYIVLILFGTSNILRKTFKYLRCAFRDSN